MTIKEAKEVAAAELEKRGIPEAGQDTLDYLVSDALKISEESPDISLPEAIELAVDGVEL